MNIQEYINSGVLELYVADALPANEQQEVVEMATKHPEIKQQIAAIEQVIEAFARANARTPRPELKAQIMAALPTIEAENEALQSAATVESEPKVVAMPSWASQTWTNYAAVASIALLIGSSFLNVFLYNNWQTAKTHVDNLLAEKSVMAENNNASVAKYEQQLATVTNPNVKIVSLKGQANAPQAKVTVYWSKEKQATLAVIQNLPTAPEGKQYQLWALLDGKPIDAGMLDSLDTPQRMKDIANAQAFAITLEVKGGSPTPHLEQLYAMGAL